MNTLGDLKAEIESRAAELVVPGRLTDLRVSHLPREVGLSVHTTWRKAGGWIPLSARIYLAPPTMTLKWNDGSTDIINLAEPNIDPTGAIIAAFHGFVSGERKERVEKVWDKFPVPGGHSDHITR